MDLSIAQVLLALKLVFTCISDEGRGAAAVAAVQQRSTPEVRVQQRDSAAQFGESEPRAHVLRRVPVKERNGLTRVHERAFPQRVCDSVTDPVRVPVREDLTLEHEEGLLRVTPRDVREPVQNRVARRCAAEPVHQPPDVNRSEYENKILSKVRETNVQKK